LEAPLRVFLSAHVRSFGRGGGPQAVRDGSLAGRQEGCDRGGGGSPAEPRGGTQRFPRGRAQEGGGPNADGTTDMKKPALSIFLSKPVYYRRGQKVWTSRGLKLGRENAWPLCARERLRTRLLRAPLKQGLPPNARTTLQVHAGKPPGVNYNPPLSESDRCGLVVDTWGGRVSESVVHTRRVSLASPGTKLGILACGKWVPKRGDAAPRWNSWFLPGRSSAF